MVLSSPSRVRSPADATLVSCKAKAERYYSLSSIGVNLRFSLASTVRFYFNSSAEAQYFTDQ